MRMREMIASTSVSDTPKTGIFKTETSNDATGDQVLYMAGVGIRKIGMPDARGAPLTLTIQNANQGVMGTLIDGKTERTLGIHSPTETVIEMAASPRGRTASRAAPNLKGAGSATRLATKALKPMMINRYGPENGVVTATARTATGLAARSSTKSLNGWIAMIETSHDELTRRRILSAGRSA